MLDSISRAKKFLASPITKAKKYTTHVLELSELFSVEGEYITNGSYRTILSSVRGVKHLCLDGQRNNLGTLDLSHKLFSGGSEGSFYSVPLSS